MVGRWCRPERGLLTCIHFHCARGFATPVLAGMLDSLVRVSRRGEENHFVRTGRRRGDTPRPIPSPSAPKRHGDVPSALRSLPRRHPALATAESVSDRRPEGRRRASRPPDTGFLRFPFSNFRHSLTLFSKFFASFPHGTCSLSVSHSCLALDGIYHPL